MKFFLAEAKDLAYEVGFQEGFSAADIELSHACVCKQAEAPFGFVERQDGQIFGSMEAEVARIIAFSASYVKMTCELCGHMKIHLCGK
jgi:hypothetical protein